MENYNGIGSDFNYWVLKYYYINNIMCAGGSYKVDQVIYDLAEHSLCYKHKVSLLMDEGN